MRRKDFYYNSQPQSWTKYLSLIVLVIFCFTVTTFAVFEVSNFYSDEATVKSIIIDGFKSYKSAANVKNSPDENKQLSFFKAERQARAAAEINNTIASKPKSNYYYEEQKPVVVYSKTDIESPIARQQMAEVPPKQDVEEDDPYSKAYDGDYEGSDDDYFGQPEPPKQTQVPSYYRQPQDEQEQSTTSYYGQQPQPPNTYYRQRQSYYGPAAASSQYYDDSKENIAELKKTKLANPQDARSSQYQDRNNYYRQYPYVTPAPPALRGSFSNKPLSAMNRAAYRNMQRPTNNQEEQQMQYRDPYPSYMDDYEYQPSDSHSPAASQTSYFNRKSPPQRPQYRTPSTPSPAAEKPETGQTMDFLTMFKSIKTMWDLYQSFTSSWNTVAERRNREQELARQKYKQQQQQQQTRINSKKPPKFNTRRNTTVSTKSPRKQFNMMLAATTTAAPPEETENANEKQPLAKVEPRKETEMRAKNEKSLRDKRQTDDDLENSTSLSEGRYIKGDPLKGYYDFVITEGSYKFWAVFQVGTAILIIYSTFAAIYYSKVNPLVSDYDYTDYLGGARSLSGGDFDFVDDADEQQNSNSQSWLTWLPRTGHSLKFILEAIDKLPTDHADEKSGEVIADTTEYSNHEFEPKSSFQNSNRGERMDESREFPSENESLSSSRQDNKAM